MNDTEKQQLKLREFLQLLPLTSELAGLPESDHGRYFTPEQIEARVITIKHAYRIARQLAVEISNQ
ncbi:MAG: hypothetical protein QM703_08640 [Gemmatales bacterium]